MSESDFPFFHGLEWMTVMETCPHCGKSISIRPDVLSGISLEDPAVCATCGGLFWVKMETRTVVALTPVEELIALMEPSVRLLQVSLRMRGGPSE